MHSRELVKKTLEFKNERQRVPRQLWRLPWAEIHHGAALKRITDDFPDDIITADGYQKVPCPTRGEQYEPGEYVDEWGCIFVNLQRGVIGEVKEPLIQDEDWADASKVHIPEELLTIDQKRINADCAASDKFIMAGECPRPFEQLQFLRGTENLYIDLALGNPGLLRFLDKMHDFYCRWVEKWAQSDVDGIMMMDDWGSQRGLLISPELWQQYFKPLYRDYIAIARKHGKKTFMHSDGYTLQIIPHLIDIGLDAFNTQIFCMDFADLEQFKGQITFWGEVDRQHLLAHATPDEVKQAVRDAAKALWSDGGCIAQCEFGAGARPENIRAVFTAWQELR